MESKVWHRSCSLSLLVFINGWLKEVKEAELGVQLCNGKSIGGMLFADDFVRVNDSKKKLEKLY